MDLFDALRTRRSIRSYRPDPVEKERLALVLEAGRLAPSACNSQPWRFVVLEGEQVPPLRAAYDREWFTSAPAVIIVGCDHEGSWHRADGKDFGDIDCAIALDHMTLAAAALGLGTCWIGAFKPQPLRALPPFEGRYEPVAMTPIGYPDQLPPPKGRKELAEVVRWKRL